jgi:hypothetical protein
MNAIANLATHTDHSRDDARAKMQTAADISTQRVELNERRKAQAKLAGEATPESIEAEIRASRAANSSLWRVSESCDPNRITRDVTKAFCKGLADLEAKKAAAVKRDQIDASLAKLTEKAETKGEAPSTVDSFADAMADGLSAFGYHVDEKAKLAIVRARDWSKAIGVEVLAAFGPAALLGLFLRGNAPLPAPMPKPVMKPSRLRSILSGIVATPAKAEPVVMGEAPCDLAAEFASESLDHSPGAFVSNPAMWAAWTAYCARRKVDPGTKKGLQARLKAHAVYENNNNRPRYRNVRIKAVAPAHGGLRLAVSN